MQSFKYLVVAACFFPLAAFAQITNTRHDLASASTSPGPKATAASGQTQTCVFCHTPHRSLAQNLLWNHNLSAGTRGWTAGTVTARGTPLPAAISADSMRCLSCHDGTVGLGNVNNIGNGTAGTIATTAAAPTAGYLTGNGAAGNEMVNNHPVSIPYAGLTVGGVVSRAVADNAIGNYFSVVSTGCASPSGFCTSAATNGTLINLKGTVATALTVECSSCHDPHNKYGANLYMLRVTATSSALCRSCHNI